MTGSKSVMASKQFVADFDTVCARYGLTEAEKQEAREAARRDLENAETCFAALAKEDA